MNFKKIFGLSVMIGGLSLFGNSITSHAIEYERTYLSAWGDVSDDYAYDILEVSDGSFVIVGSDFKKGSYVLKLDKNLEEEWIRYVDCGSSGMFTSVVERNGDLLVVGSTEEKIMDFELKGRTDALILKMNLKGDLLSGQTFGGNNHDLILNVVNTSDGGFAVVGVSYSTNMSWANSNGYKPYIAKYNSNEEQEWIKAFDDAEFGDFQSIIETSDGGLVAVGTTGNNGAIIVKYTKDGEQEWSRNFKHSDATGNEYFNDVVETSHGDLIVVGSGRNRTVISYDYDPLILRYDASGEFQDEYTVTGSPEWDTLNGITALNDGSLVIVGDIDERGVVVRLEKNGETKLLIDENCNSYTSFWAGLQTSDGELLIIGNTYATDLGFENKGESDAFLMKFSQKKDSDIQINGSVETMVADVTIPSVSPDLVINPNLPEGSVSPEFTISNDSVSPIKLELKTFEQTTNTFNDVLPTKYDSWVGLNKTQSQDIALGLVAKEGNGWQSLTTPTSYAAGHNEHEIGIIKPTSSVDFSFDVKHGTSFSEVKTVQYKMVFVFDLLN